MTAVPNLKGLKTSTSLESYDQFLCGRVKDVDYVWLLQETLVETKFPPKWLLNTFSLRRPTYFMESRVTIITNIRRNESW